MTSRASDTTTVLRGRVVTPTRTIPDGVVVVHGDTIAHVGPAEPSPAPPPPPSAATLLPGLVDVHCHGGGGAGFPDVTSEDEARAAVREHLAHGTTTLVASLVTAAPADPARAQPPCWPGWPTPATWPASTSRARSCRASAAGPRTPT